MSVAKRKADYCNVEIEGRPTLKKRGTSLLGNNGLGLIHNNGGNDDMMLDNDTGLQTPPPSPDPLSTFQHKLSTFYNQYHSSFGTAQLNQLQGLHVNLAYSSEREAILCYGQQFISFLEQYIQELQSTAIEQVRLRARLLDLGISVGGSMDSILASLDERIIVLGVELEGIAESFRLAQ